VGEFVSQELPTTRTAGAVRTLTEKDVLTYGEGTGVQRSVECVGLGVGVHLDAAEVSAEGRLHPGAHPTIQRPPAAAGPQDGLFYIRSNYHFPVRLSDQGQDPLHVSVPVLPLRLEQGLHGL
jgi:hypothetical protein